MGEKFWAMMTLPVDILLACGLIMAGIAIIKLWGYLKDKDKVIAKKDELIAIQTERTLDGAKALERLATLIETLVNRGR